jgi:hypothetical protein
MLTKSWKPDRKPCFLSTWSLANGILTTTEQDSSAQFIWAFSVLTAEAREPYVETTNQTGTSDGHHSAVILL